MTEFGSFDNSTCKRVLDLLEPGDLTLGLAISVYFTLLYFTTFIPVSEWPVVNVKFYAQILSTKIEVSFYIYNRPLSGIHVIAGFCA